MPESPAIDWRKPLLKIPQTIKTILLSIFSAAIILASANRVALAGDAAIVGVEITPSGNGVYTISVTLEHADTGWDHYANRWDVLDENGELIGSRVLAHPHVNEQPFTRSLRVEIPKHVKTVTIVASDSVHGDNEQTFDIEVPAAD